MNYLHQVQKALDYIEAHLDADISLARVAREAAISQWHFARIFKALTNETLKSYIRSRRLSNALDKLLTTDERIIEIAMDTGFASQESFSRAFKKIFDLSPHAARKLGKRNMAVQKVKFDAEYLRHIHQNISLTPEIYSLPKRLFIGMKTEFFSVDSEKNNIAEKLPPLWEEFLAHIDEIEHRVAGNMYGIIKQTPENSDRLEYYAAVEVSQVAALPAGMSQLELPATTYAKFRHDGHFDSLNNSVNYIYSSWLFASGARHNYGADLEIYGAEYNPNTDDSVIYYAIPLERKPVYG
ncbi:MAG: AraC family transcriptional regulator [Alphaproteobacteria bacterium]|nr:AraC family transcriptional regulator [Alphaproteobacteria bacterium]